MDAIISLAFLLVSLDRLNKRYNQNVLNQCPITFGIMIVCVGSFVVVNLLNLIPMHKMAFFYGSIVYNWEIYRFLTSIFTHGNLVHLVNNLVGIYDLTIYERLNSLKYLGILIYAFVMNSILEMLVIYLVKKLYFIGFHSYDVSVGFSGILYTFMSLNVFSSSANNVEGMVEMAKHLIINQILVPNSSIVGHLVGAVSGFMLSSKIPLIYAVGFGVGAFSIPFVLNI